MLQFKKNCGWTNDARAVLESIQIGGDDFKIVNASQIPLLVTFADHASLPVLLQSPQRLRRDCDPQRSSEQDYLRCFRLRI